LKSSSISELSLVKHLQYPWPEAFLADAPLRGVALDSVPLVWISIPPGILNTRDILLLIKLLNILAKKKKIEILETWTLADKKERKKKIKNKIKTK
jgi:hypothetical protein